MSQGKFCVTCHWARNKYGSVDKWQCASPYNVKETTNLVSGSNDVIVETCHVARLHENLCGKEGKWFESTKEAMAKHMPRLYADLPVPRKKITMDDL
jgi:hypothetical protein